MFSNVSGVLHMSTCDLIDIIANFVHLLGLVLIYFTHNSNAIYKLFVCTLCALVQIIRVL